MFEYLVESFGLRRIVTKHTIQSAGLGFNTIQYQSDLVFINSVSGSSMYVYGINKVPVQKINRFILSSFL